MTAPTHDDEAVEREKRLVEALKDIERRGHSGRDTGWGSYTDGYAAGQITAANTARQALEPYNDK